MDVVGAIAIEPADVKSLGSKKGLVLGFRVWVYGIEGGRRERGKGEPEGSAQPGMVVAYLLESDTLLGLSGAEVFRLCVLGQVLCESLCVFGPKP